MANPKNQEQRTFRLEGFQDLLGTMESREAASAGRQAAGANVEPVDSEWWVRPGYFPIHDEDRQDAFPNLGSIPWWTVVDPGEQTSGDIFVYLVNPFYVLRFKRTGSFDVRAAYLPAATGIEVSFTNNSKSATRVDAATITVGQLLLVDGSHLSRADAVYRVVAYSDPTITLDRVYADSTGSKTNCSFVNPITDPTAYFSGAGNRDVADLATNGKFGVAVIDQSVTRSGSTLGYANEATVAGDQYLIITSEVAAPAAVNLSDFSKPLDDDFFRDTSVEDGSGNPAPTKNLRGWVCCTWQNQLVIGHAGDANGEATNRSIWLSQPWDYQSFHDGTPGENASSRDFNRDGFDDPILAVLPLGRDLIAHRSRSQDIGSPYEDPPVIWTRNQQGFGAVNCRSIVAANNVHYLWSQVGPAVFNGVSVAPLAIKYREYLKSLGLWAISPLMAYDDRLRSRVCWVFNDRKSRYLSEVKGASSTVSVPITASDTDTTLKDRCTVVCFDYTRNYLWIEDSPTFVGSGLRDDRTYLAGVYGNIYDTSEIFEDNTVGKDTLHTGSTEVVPAFVETPWFNLNSIKRKHLHTLYVELRALSTTDNTKPWEIEDLWSGTSDALRFCNVEIFADHETDVKQTLTGCQLTVSTMLNLAADADRNHPIMLMQLSPRVSGNEFKLRFNNLGISAPTKQGHFRISAVEGVYEQEQSSRYREPLNK